MLEGESEVLTDIGAQQVEISYRVYDFIGLYGYWDLCFVVETSYEYGLGVFGEFIWESRRLGLEVV